jgi:hypothetical protein
LIILTINLVGKDDHDDSDRENFFYHKRFDFGRFNPRQLFTDDVAILCFEISYHVSYEDYDPPILDLDFRRKLWQTRETVISDLVLKVDGKEIKVSYYNKAN